MPVQTHYSKRPSVEELIKEVEGKKSREEVESYLKDALFEDGCAIVNRKHCTDYLAAIREHFEGPELPEELQIQISTKNDGVQTRHYAHEVISNIQASIIGRKRNDVPETALDKAVRAQNAAKKPFPIGPFIDTAREFLRSSDWRKKLFAVCLLTGRRVGAVAYEASFEVVNKSQVRVVSGQKKRGDISVVTIPVLDDAELICEAVSFIAEEARKTHTKPYERWLSDPSDKNAHKLTNSINGSSIYKKIFDTHFRILFKGAEEDYAHGLRAVYGVIIAKCNEATVKTTTSIFFVQMVLDHEASDVTEEYIDNYSIEGIEDFLENAPEEFLRAVDAETYIKAQKKFMPFDIDTGLQSMRNENARTVVAAMLEHPESFAENLLREFDRLWTLSEQFKPRTDSAAEKIERIVKAMMDYNVSQLGSSEPKFIKITTKSVDDAGELIYGATFDSDTKAGIMGGMRKDGKIEGLLEQEIQQHHAAMIKEGMSENQNLKYRRGNKMKEILQEVALQHGAV